MLEKLCRRIGFLLSGKKGTIDKTGKRWSWRRQVVRWHRIVMRHPVGRLV